MTKRCCVCQAVWRQPFGPEILRRLDVLIAGPYLASQHHARGLVGTANQRIHLLTSRHTQADFEALPSRELILHADGTATITGIVPTRLGL